MGTSPDSRTAVLVDQHPLWLDTVAQVVSRVGVEVVGKATSSTAALALVEEARPRLLITGIKMANDEIDGIALIRQALERVSGMKAIVLSMYDDPQHIDAAFAAGAAAYVLKTAHPDDLTSAIRQAFDHSIYLAGARPAAAPAPAAVEDSPGLTRRELEILQLVAEGHSNAELARMLWVTEQTVKFHLSNIYRKLNVSNRTEASRWAQLRGLLSTPAPVEATA
ncbi:MAG TPA: response regulator transcription factor [Gaiellaceae bacterium]|jgi:two-component system response regulator DevR|nr:response regulator transcription factor [Gaiellaceae bacterium]